MGFDDLFKILRGGHHGGGHHRRQGHHDMITMRTTIIVIITGKPPAAQGEMLIAIRSKITVLDVRDPFKGTSLFAPNVGLIFNGVFNVKAAVPV